jgi:hypothetical protein
MFQEYLMRGSDSLYQIFEDHLFNALVENESEEDLLKRVIHDYLCELSRHGSLLQQHRVELEIDLREEVLEMLRKKTYGSFSLSEFRKSKECTIRASSDSPRSSSAPSHTKKTPARGRRSS